jgi:uracil-DNA glycosylase
MPFWEFARCQAARNKPQVMKENAMNFTLAASWRHRLHDEMKQPYFQELAEFVRQEYASKTVYPPPGKIFAAFEAVPFEQAKVVILGQDPYHGPNQANGLAFSVNDGIRIPPSLKNKLFSL